MINRILVILLIILSLVPMVLLTSCTSLKANIKDNTENVGPVFCEIFQPISWSNQDTEKTKDQIFEHNSVWDVLCLEDA